MGGKKEIQAIRDQERRLQFDRFTNDDAIELGTMIVELARQRKLAIAVDLRRFDYQLFHAALDGTSPDNGSWIRRKSNVVQRFHCASLRMGLELDSKKTTISERYGVPELDFAPHGGSFPIRLRNVGVIGAVTVSGLPQKDDHALVVEVLEAFLGRHEVPPST